MTDLFLSYRRQDSGGHVAALQQALRERFGRERVFMDTSKIEAGKSWSEEIDRALESCKVFLAVIGPDWSISRLEDPDDWVRREILAALAREKQESGRVSVIPVLVGGAQAPQPEELRDEVERAAQTSKRTGEPADQQRLEALQELHRLLEGLLRHQLFQIRPDDSRESETERLLRQIPLRPSLRYQLGQRRMQIGLAVVGAALVLVLVLLNQCSTETVTDSAWLGPAAADVHHGGPWA